MSTGARTHIANIGARGEVRRRRNGIFWAVAALVALAMLMVLQAPHWTRLLLVVPFGLAAVGLLQAREKT